MSESEYDRLVAQLGALRDRIWEGDNTHCFCERERILIDVAQTIGTVPPVSRYAHTLERLLGDLSVPIGPDDVFLGRMVEGPPPEGWERSGNPPYLQSSGHTTLDWVALLRKGLDQIALEAQVAAEQEGTGHVFAENVRRCCRAVVSYARRYAAEARSLAANADPDRRSSLLRAAAALERSPAGPADGFFVALQTIWFVQLITSCVIGSRDFCFGRLDQYLYALYRRDLERGTLTRDVARAYLAHFFLKTKEITGTATDNYQTKPTPCHASNQYATIGGRSPDGDSAINELSYLILEAACLAQVPQPGINVRIDPSSPSAFKTAVAGAMEVCAPQLNLWNDSAILATLARDYPQIARGDAINYAFTACNRINLPAQDYPVGWEYWHVMPEWMLEVLSDRDGITSLARLLDRFRSVAEREVGDTVKRATLELREADPAAFHFESILLQDCIARARDLQHGGLRYVTQYHLFAGLATVADSLTAIQCLVFDEQRFTLGEYLEIVAADYAGREALRQEILYSFPHYGNNDAQVDTIASQVSTIAFDSLRQADNPDGHLLFPALYSLHNHYWWGKGLPATPDGRRAGQPLSENQSPAYGRDREGLSALLLSAAALPHERTVMGGLNVKFGGKLPGPAFVAMLDTFFEIGGVHLGLTCVGRDTLLAARDHPERYRDLCVRVAGFSEYFRALSPAAQQELIDRTEY